MEINDRLRMLREKAGKSQAKFAIDFNLPQSTYAQYEKGGRAVPDDLKQQLAQMGINIHWLVTGKGPVYLDRSSETQNEGFVVEKPPCLSLLKVRVK